MSRQSLYTPEQGPKVLDMMRIGASKIQVARALGVSTKTLVNWRDMHPDFDEYMTLGEEASQAYYEDIMHDYATNPDLKSNAAVKALDFLVSNRFRANYGKSSTQEININHSMMTMSDKEIDAQIQRLLSVQAEELKTIDHRVVDRNSVTLDLKPLDYIIMDEDKHE